ncbi:MAG: repeat protein [Capsulimonas sp.]|jgi:HEAT repeat protein|nr:repeat protein [Capsulimonas sp.]
MDNSQSPADHIQELVELRRGWSDEEVLAELKAMSVLPDEDDPAWTEEGTWRDQANLFVALADITAERRLRPAILLLLERACFGDPGEMMRGLRHSLEAIVNPDWDYLVEICIAAARLPQRGARLWAIEELGVLRDKRALPVLEEALRDETPEIQSAAERSIQMIQRAG